jgi:hypothetical protein
MYIDATIVPVILHQNIQTWQGQAHENKGKPRLRLIDSLKVPALY